MSYQPGRTSPKPPELPSEEEFDFSVQPPTVRYPSPPGLNRAVQYLLTPQPARSGVGGTTVPSRGRGSRSPVGPLVSSPLRISSSAMASAPSSPERPKAGTEDIRRRSSDQFTREERRASTGHVLGLEDATKSDVTPSPEIAASRKRSMPRDKQGRSAMAAVMSGLESRLLPKSFTRGRDSSRGSSRRGSSLDSRSPSSSSRPGRSVSPSTQPSDSTTKPTAADTEKSKPPVILDNTQNKSDEALAKPSGGLPDYVKPAEQADSGERLAKDVFDRDKNIIESSEDDADDLTSEDEHIPGVQVVHTRGRKKKGSDISTITPSDFNKPKESKAQTPEERTFLVSFIQIRPRVLFDVY